MKRPLRIVIVGGGIGGLAACIAARQKGIEAVVYEQSPAFSQVGAGIQVGPNAVKVLRALGLEQQLRSIAFEPKNFVGRSWQSGRVLFKNPIDERFQARFGAPYFQVHRADLHQILYEALPESAVKFGAQCTGVVQEGGSAAARFADGTAAEGDVVIGADGIRSKVRDAILGHSEPRFTGIVCWRGQVRADRMKPGLLTGDSFHWLGPKASVVHYFVKRGEVISYVAHRKTDVWAEESWVREAEISEVKENFNGWHSILQALFDNTERCYKWAMFDRDPLESWSRGRVTLLGDAAHPMLPFLAQGGAMALEDGAVLAKALANAGENVAQALLQYEVLRRDRTGRIQIGSRARADALQLSSRWQILKRDFGYFYDRWLNFRPALFGSPWIYDYDASAVDVQGTNNSSKRQVIVPAIAPT